MIQPWEKDFSEMMAKKRMLAAVRRNRFLSEYQCVPAPENPEFTLSSLGAQKVRDRFGISPDLGFLARLMKSGKSPVDMDRILSADAAKDSAIDALRQSLTVGEATTITRLLAA